jgi:hypothetical protein
MAVDVPMLVVTLLMMFFIPGYTLTQAVFPRKNEVHPKDDLIHRLILAIGLSMAISVFTGFTLSSLGTDEEGMGYFRSGNFLLALASISAVLFLIGLVRGAYPRLGFARERPVEFSLGPEQRAELIEAMKEWKEITRKLEDIELAKGTASDSRAASLRQKEASLLKRAKELERGLAGLGVKDIDRGDRSSRLQSLIHEWRSLRTKVGAERRKVESTSGAQRDHHRAGLKKMEDRLDELDAEIEKLRDEID